MPTSAPINLWVATDGNDSNPGTELQPFATLQAALDSLESVEKKILHLCTVNVGLGNFAGAVIQGFKFGRADDSTFAGLKIRGQMKTPVLTGGATSGTVTAVAAASLPNNKMFVIEDNTQAWVTDELKGKFIKITGGTGSASTFNTHEIIGNNATQVMIAQTSTAAAAGSTYDIIENGTFINQFRTMSNIDNLIGTSVLNAMVHVYGNVGNPATGAEIQLEQIGFTYSGTSVGYVAHIDEQMVKVGLTRCYVAPISNINTGIRAKTPVSVVQCGILTGGVTVVGPYDLFVNRSHVVGSIGVQVLGWARASVSQSYIRGNRGIVSGNSSIIELANVLIDNCIHGIQTQGIDTQFAVPGYNIIHCGGNVGIHNCSANAIALSGPSQFTLRSSVLSGQGNANGILMHRGSKVQVASTTTLTGTTEVNLDGAIYSLANLRSNSPKVLSSAWGSTIWEDN